MALEIKVPSVGESITEVTISSWAKSDGDYVELDELICEIESDKATFELTAESAGTLHILVEEGETVAVGDKIATIDTDAKAEGGGKKEESAKAVKEEEKTTAKAEADGAGKKTPAYADHHPSPAAQKILNEKGIKPENVEGTGRDGRITKEDAQKAEAKKPAAAEEKAKAPAAAPAVPGERNTRREKMTTLRKTIAKRLVEAKNHTAMLTTFNEVDMSAVMELRKKYKDAFKEKHQVGLGFMSFFTKAVTEALREFPAVNGMIDEGEIVYHDYMDVGIAVSTPRGLVVPVIRNAETLSLADIEKNVLELALKARDNKLSIEEMTGGTFTITNGGIFGSMLSTPILNAPQSAILGMHNIVERPVVVNGEIVIRPIMYLALSYDHRIVDGRESVSFLKKVKEMIEDPGRMLLGV